MAKKAIIALYEGSVTSGVVENIIEIAASSPISLTLPAGRIMWDCGQYPVAIGDEWNDGVFTRNGEALVPIPSVESRLYDVETAINALLTGEAIA